MHHANAKIKLGSTRRAIMFDEQLETVFQTKPGLSRHFCSISNRRNPTRFPMQMETVDAKTLVDFAGLIKSVVKIY